MPLEVKYWTLIASGDGHESVIMKFANTRPPVPSCTVIAWLRIVGPSSSVMLPVPVASVMPRLKPLERALLICTKKFSFSSSTLSPSTLTRTFLVTSPAAKVSVPVVEK